MAEIYAHETHFDYSGGVDQSVGHLILAENESNFIENGELYKIGPVTKTRGYTQRGTDVNTNYNILGMCNAVKPSSGTRKQIVIADGASNSDAYTINPSNGIWTPHGLSLTTAAKAEFESFLNGFFMVNFSDVTRFNDLTQWYITTNVTNAPKAKYIKQYLSRLYLGYVVDGGTTYPSRIIYCDLPTGTPETITWNNSINWFDVATDDGDVIMGEEVNSSRLLIFKMNSLYRYDTNTLYIVPGCPGTVSQRSVRTLMGMTLYLHSTGIWGYNGESSQLMSRKIQELIDGISAKSQNDANAWIQGDHYYLYVGDVNNMVTGFKVDKCLIDYDIAKNAFAWRSLEDTPLVWMSYPNDTTNITYDSATITYDDANTMYDGTASAADRIYFGTDSGKVMEFNKGGNYNDKAISFRFETKDYYMGYPSFWKLIQKVIVYTDYAGRGLKMMAKLDDKNWITLIPSSNQINQVQREYLFPSGSLCNRVRFALVESSTGSQFSFEGLDIYLTAQGLLR